MNTYCLCLGCILMISLALYTGVSVMVNNDLAKGRGEERPKHFTNLDPAVSFGN